MRPARDAQEKGPNDSAYGDKSWVAASMRPARDAQEKGEATGSAHVAAEGFNEACA
mgnify:CR=1 FL=1